MTLMTGRIELIAPGLPLPGQPRTPGHTLPRRPEQNRCGYRAGWLARRDLAGRLASSPSVSGAL